MPRTPKELTRAVCKKFDQTDAEWIEGPCRLGDYIVHEVWTQDKGSPYHYHAHHTAERGGNLEILADFLGFVNWLTDRVNAAVVHDAWERRLRLAVATMVVLVGLGLLVYLMVWQPERSGEIKYLLAALVGAAAGYVFGNKSGREGAVITALLSTGERPSGRD